MGNKKGLFSYMLVGVLGAAAGAAAMLGFSRQIPALMEKCCAEMKGKCCGEPEPKKPAARKRKKAH
jgi:hypothetical protein